jgi:uncharacterized protein (DUF488 family)
VWWQCHRRIIADYLMAADEIVFHIMGGGRIERATQIGGMPYVENCLPISLF